MPSLETIHRFGYFARREGCMAVVKRALLGLRRTFTGDRQVLFRCALSNFNPECFQLGEQEQVQRIDRASELATEDLEQMTRAWYPPAVRRQVSERFAHGAVLWLFRSGPALAGYGWTLRGRTIEPYFFPLRNNEAHLFDFFVFPEFRGRRINLILMTMIFRQLAEEGADCAFIETAEWNTPQLRSLRRLPFERIGCARVFRLLGRTVVVWSEAFQRERIEAVHPCPQRP
jgi:ribosomal protein S18 acetylase RimI-like enzyme